ncbi:hypothetical protein E2C01_036001 [Portunus trituberculatus]|uniref:Uncharacterized protein n=1 Tax=Portunus trituberculatus TaxID=210409 RepID=A0A5B7F4N2_PORTR|nr:hypothetical protein [Portunus trituberculatus]
MVPVDELFKISRGRWEKGLSWSCPLVLCLALLSCPDPHHLALTYITTTTTTTTTFHPFLSSTLTFTSFS